MRVRLLALIFIACSTIAAAPKSDAVRAILSHHDPEHRLPETSIRTLGIIRERSSIFSIFYLSFTNPQSHHGQQRIAIIKNDREFMGSYQCTLGPNDGVLKLGRDWLMVTNAEMSFVVRFTERGPTHNKYFCGEGSGWEDSI